MPKVKRRKIDLNPNAPTEKRRTNFTFREEKHRRGREEFKHWGVEPANKRIFEKHPQVFGTQKRVKGAEWIGIDGVIDETKKTLYSSGFPKVLKIPKFVTNWHVDRRKKKGTITDRKTG